MIDTSHQRQYTSPEQYDAGLLQLSVHSRNAVVAARLAGLQAPQIGRYVLLAQVGGAFEVQPAEMRPPGLLYDHLGGVAPPQPGTEACKAFMQSAIRLRKKTFMAMLRSSQMAQSTAHAFTERKRQANAPTPRLHLGRHGKLGARGFFAMYAFSKHENAVK